MRMSYSLFCRLRPFWILFPKASDRSTCLCKTHENLLYKIEKLHQLKVTDTTNVTFLANEITCSTDSLSCMYREYFVCLKREPHINQDDLGCQVYWNMWETRREDRQKTSCSKEEKSLSLQITIKSTVQGTLDQLVTDFKADLAKASKHTDNISHQYKALRTLRERNTGQRGSTPHLFL